jgi:hypothetical protein
MEYLARKFDRPKWVLKDSQDYLQPDKIGAYSVTNCLRATDDKLSFWLCNLASDDLDEVALALATPMQALETIDIVIFHIKEFEADSITLKATVGNCPVDDLVSRHRDAIEIDLAKLSLIARRVADKARDASTDRCKRIAKSALKNIVRKAIAAGRVNPASLQKSFLKDLSLETGTQ